MTPTGRADLRPRLSAFCLAAALAAPAAHAAELSSPDTSDLRRAYAAASLSTSEQPAVRAERAQREPSPGFMLGAALGAWTAARAQLDFDLKNPSAAGPPHASQGAAVDEAIDQDCADERAAFARLDVRAKALALDPAQVLASAAVPDAALPAAWRARQAAGPAGCVGR